MDIYLRIFGYVRPYWKHLAASIIFTVFFSIFSGLSIYLTIPLLETLFDQDYAEGGPQAIERVEPAAGEESPAVVGSFEKLRESLSLWFASIVFTGDQFDALFRICVIIIFVFFLKNITGFLQSYMLAFVEQGVVKDLRDSIFRHLHNLSLSYFTNERTGDLISRITNDVNIVQQSIGASFLNLVREPLLVLVFLSIALMISWQLTLISIAVIPVTMLFIRIIGKQLKRDTGKSQQKMADITTVLQETISGVKVVKAFGMEKFETRKFAEQTRQYFKRMLKIARMRYLAHPITEFLSVLAGVIIIWYGGRQVLELGTLRPAEFMGFLFAIFQMMPPMKNLTSVMNRLQESAAAASRVFIVMDTEPSVMSMPNAVELDGFYDALKFKNVTFAYPTKSLVLHPDNGYAVLKDISFTVKKGEVVAIVGPSGSGKTTLIDLIPRFYDPNDGAIFIDGYDLRNVDIKSLRRLIGIVTQETILFNDTLRNNIAYGLDDCSDEVIVAAAKAANADVFIREFPHGYETVIGDRGVRLSGGQRQRISIARALLKNPPIMILDEATSALDSESEILVQEAIDKLMQNRTSFVIAHRLSTVRNADKIFVIDRGIIVQQGTHSELMDQASGLYQKLYDMQFHI
jgi:ATP-binding cassette, subfamily B, bacterial MsbA